MKVKHKSSTLQQYLSSTLVSTQLRSFDQQFAEALPLCAPASSYTGFCVSRRIALPLFRDLNPLVSEFPISVARFAVPSRIQALIPSSYESQKGLPLLIAVSGRMQALNQPGQPHCFAMNGNLLNNCNETFEWPMYRHRHTLWYTIRPNYKKGSYLSCVTHSIPVSPRSG